MLILIQTFISALFFFLAYKVLKRNFNRITLTLSFFYILPGFSFILNIIFLPLSNTLIGFIIYFIALFLLLFAFIFLEIFILNLINIDLNLTLKKQVIIILFYGIAIFLLLNIPGGIRLNEGTNWIPVFSWYFFIAICIFFTSVIYLPIIIFSIKLFYTFEDKKLRRKFKYFIIGMIGMFVVLIGAALYNTWNDPTFKLFWSILINVILIPSIYLIYYGIGKNL